VSVSRTAFKLNNSNELSRRGGDNLETSSIPMFGRHGIAVIWSMMSAAESMSHPPSDPETAAARDVNVREHGENRRAITETPVEGKSAFKPGSSQMPRQGG
jgi:hypothetical protein